MRRHVLFADLEEADFERIFAMAEPVSVAAGGTLLEEGAPGDSLFVVLRGELEIARREGGREVVLATRGAGDFVGELSLLQGAPRSATARARTDTELLAIRRPAFQSLLDCSPSATLTILGTVTARLRSTEALLKQQEKLASLGTLAAGLAHELNNPAAAIRRSVEQLRRSAGEVEAAAGDLFDPAVGAAIGAARSRVAPPAAGRERTRVEEALETWLAEGGVDRGWELAPVLAGAGLDRGALEEALSPLPAAARPAAIRFLAAGLEVETVAGEATTSAAAISGIVSAVKTYSRLDEAPIQQVDVHESLESTLTILKHKLRGMHVTRSYAEGLPRLEAHGSELSQVWTNLVDNAIDATGGHGTIVLRTRGSGEVVVEIEDDGPGIPDAARARIFDPFFTTKPVGSGTGLGLHIVHNLVVERHGGQVDVESRPGRTVFTVRLPLRARR
jgi:signal transduction histidine kinase